MNKPYQSKAYYRYWLLLPLLFLAGCVAMLRQEMDERFGAANPARYDAPTIQTSSSQPLWRDVKPILDSRCVVCHACYDAPCQFKLSAYEGVTRGASKTRIYDTLRLLPTQPTRLFTDANTNIDWRHIGFYPTLNERQDTAEANREGSVLYRMLNLKRSHHWPEQGPLPAERFDFRISRDQQCPSIEEFSGFEGEHPEWGMPFGFPPISQREHQTLIQWLEAGAPPSPEPVLNDSLQSRIKTWESFLNQSSLKARLMSRYLYEHWFLAHLYFDDLPTGEFFELVRSTTLPGKPIKVVTTRLPYGDPGVSRVYYRLRPIRETRVAKTHMPFALNPARMTKLSEQFIEPSYTVTALPDYSDQAANPFKTFSALPVASRYRFMLDDAQYYIMSFIKGPVCRGQVAVDVIQDHFWIAFSNPDAIETNGAIYSSMLMNLRLPRASDTIMTPLSSWIAYADAEQNYLRAKVEYANRYFKGDKRPTLDNLWNGDGHNTNAALTVFRHFDSATVVKGLVGETPQSVLLAGYPLLERIYYLLVAGYDVFGNLAHGLHSRMYMDFLRMEGELSFLALLPNTTRNEVRDRWYREASQEVKAYLNGPRAPLALHTGIQYQTNNPYEELLRMLRTHLAPVMTSRYRLENSSLPKDARSELQTLNTLKGGGLHLLPEASFLSVRDDKGQTDYFTLLRNSAHSNVAELFNEAERRVPQEDTLTITHGFIGAYPNAYYDITTRQLAGFVMAIKKMSTEADYTEFMNRFGIRRTHPKFWAYNDEFNSAYRAMNPVEAGLFDLNRFENR